MHKDFYIFRHGETQSNVEGRWQGRSINLSLTEKGRSQALNLASRLQGLDLQIICSSPLKRAMQTAEIVAKKLGIPIKEVEELTEGCLGVVEGMIKSDIAKLNPELWEEWYGDNMIMSTRWPGGESKLEMQQRMLQGFEKMLSMPEDVIGVASHSGSMRYFFLKFGYGPHKMPNTALYHLSYDDGQWTFEVM